MWRSFIIPFFAPKTVDILYIRGGIVQINPIIAIKTGKEYIEKGVSSRATLRIGFFAVVSQSSYVTARITVSPSFAMPQSPEKFSSALVNLYTVLPSDDCHLFIFPFMAIMSPLSLLLSYAHVSSSLESTDVRIGRRIERIIPVLSSVAPMTSNFVLVF